jgi:hypothetical protein
VTDTGSKPAGTGVGGVVGAGTVDEGTVRVLLGVGDRLPTVEGGAPAIETLCAVLSWSLIATTAAAAAAASAAVASDATTRRRLG